MWKVVERAMAIVGLIATLIGTFVAVYAFVFPNDLTQRVQGILDRLESEPVLEEAERIYAQQFMCMGGVCAANIMKQTTASIGEFEFVVCNAGTKVFAQTFGFGKEMSFHGPTFRSPGATKLDLIIRGDVAGREFSRRETWMSTGASSGMWSRPNAPAIVAGLIDCTG